MVRHNTRAKINDSKKAFRKVGAVATGLTTNNMDNTIIITTTKEVNRISIIIQGDFR